MEWGSKSTFHSPMRRHKTFASRHSSSSGWLSHRAPRYNESSNQGVLMPIQTTANIWHNGQLIPWDKAQIHVMSHVVHYGSSVFEGIRCYTQGSNAGVFRLQEHMQRLIDSAKIYRMPLPYTVEQL